jgi:CPA2 family monovalent cation:H+ antiporter-2
VEKVCNDELSLLLALTVCLVIAAITEAIGLSPALGAFVGGMLLGSSDYAHKLAAHILPIRDAFVALFFVTIGMLIDPSTWISNWRLVAVIVFLILVGKFAVWFAILRLFRYPAQTALRVGIGLTQIGEFSFILAQVSLHSKLIGKDVYNATLAASLVTIVANAALFKLTKPAPLGQQLMHT